PVSIPYTTAASQFLYGSNVIFAALRARRRKLYHLYLHPRFEGRSDTDKHDTVIAAAKRAGIPVQKHTDLALMDKMSGSRPHNGAVLEASKLPAPPVLALGKVEGGRVALELERQSREESEVNGSPEAFEVLKRTWRQPFLLFLDGILDPGNLGGILRSAHFFGVDAVAVATNTCATLDSAVVAKASSGACEALRLFSIPKPSAFIHDSREAGWKIHAAVAPDAGNGRRQIMSAEIATKSPLAEHPVILMLGAEGAGLRANLVKHADKLVSIQQGERAGNMPDVGLDSLNVGVAAGVLIEAFLRKPVGAQSRASEERTADTGDLGF
ncbi:hypothetical protein BAUCODRAFT_78076, partial [Baudoinia panamericana UAMH 10762]